MSRARHKQEVSKYTDIWDSYRTKYEGIGKAQELQKKCGEIQLMDEQSRLIKLSC